MKDKKSFEEALERLETVSKLLESGDKPLEETIQLYEEGMQLLKYCTDKLNTAEKKIQSIMANTSDEIVLKNFEPNNSEQEY